MKCANCDNPALYVYDTAGVRPTPYCDVDLPSFLRPAARSGLLTTTDAFEGTRQSAIATLALPPEAPAPKRKRGKSTQPVEESTAPDPLPEAPEVVDSVAPEDAPAEPTEG